jgi:hypothetical protein
MYCCPILYLKTREYKGMLPQLKRSKSNLHRVGETVSGYLNKDG